MKKLLSLLLTLLVTSAFAGTPILRPVQIEDVFIPLGFDSNDSSELVVTGFLPNLCHKSPQATVVIDKNNIEIRVEALVYDETNPFCAPVVVPFVEKIELGLLDRGKSNIKVNVNTPYELKAKLAVAESSSDAIDDHIYASVEYVERIQGTRKVVLKGFNPSDCFVLDEINFIF